MKIVFLTTSYYPFFSAIGKCVFNLVEELKFDNEIIVVSNMTTRNLKSNIHYNGYKVIRIRSDYMSKRDNVLLDSESDSKNNKLKKMLVVFFLRIIGYLNVVFSKESLDKNLIEKYLSALRDIAEIDLIVPTCYPFESVVAAQRFKETTNNTVRITPFLFDKFSDSPTLHRNSFNKRIKRKNHLLLEEEMIKNSFRVLYVDSWIYNMEKYFKAYSEKLIHVEHPLIIDYFSRVSSDNISTEKGYIDIVYTGVIDKKVRPPFKMLKIISRMIESNYKMRFHFYVLGNCTDEITKYSRKYPDNILNHGRVESEIALLAIIQSNILLSIGNIDISLIPSKVFEYMSAGKPILHLYHSSEDRVISMLDEYGLGYCISQNDEISDSAIHDLVKFCNENRNSGLSFAEVQEKFYKASPKFISKLLISC